ncbi:MAG: hypothetical protein M3R02_10030 [Chloroflexota bacterium]|nr:hypothetical protein [Chloroflexota bacterium]
MTEVIEVRRSLAWSGIPIPSRSAERQQERGVRACPDSEGTEPAFTLLRQLLFEDVQDDAPGKDGQDVETDSSVCQGLRRAVIRG